MAAESDDVKDVLGRAENLEIGAWARFAGDAPGDHRSKFRGGGIEFSEVREYVAGDDPRWIDWNVSARHGRLYIKEFAEDRDLNVYIMIDCSESTTFGGTRSKWEVMTDVGASLALSALRNNNRIGLGMFSGSLDRFIPARKGRGHAVRIIREIIRCSPRTTYAGRGRSGAKNVHAGTDLARSALQLAGRIKHKSVIFVISDFITEPFAEALRRLCTRNAVVMIDVSDARELQMPDIGYAYMEDAETGGQVLVDTSSKSFQEAYAQMARKRAEATKKQARRAGAAHIETTGDGEPFAAAFNLHARAARTGRHYRTEARSSAV